MDHGARAARTRPLIAAVVLLATSGGCGGGSCPFGLIERIPFYPSISVGCCGASAFRDVGLSREDAELDLAFHGSTYAAQLVHLWLTTPDCNRLFDGDYPPATGSPAPLCTVHLGPVSPGEVSRRVKLRPGTYRVWAQALSSSPVAGPLLIDVGIWGPQCDRPPI